MTRKEVGEKGRQGLQLFSSACKVERLAQGNGRQKKIALGTISGKKRTEHSADFFGSFPI